MNFDCSISIIVFVKNIILKVFWRYLRLIRILKNQKHKTYKNLQKYLMMDHIKSLIFMRLNLLKLLFFLLKLS